MPALHLIQSSAFVGAAGQAANKIEDASAGMQKAPDQNGNVWAWNGRASQWQRIVIMKGDGTTILSTLAQKFYGSPSAWHQIADLAENVGIVGKTGDKAIPGDVLLIPNLAQPFAAPTQPGELPTGDTPTPTGGGGLTIPGFGELPVTLGDSPPAGWPSGLPWPGSGSGPTPTPTGDTPTPTGGGVDPSGAPPQVTPTGMTTTTGASSSSKVEAPFWTTGKIVAAGVVGTLVLGGIVYAATRKTRRRRRR